jgi:hypothetical protein
MGHFEVWAEDGEIVFRHSLALPHGERPVRWRRRIATIRPSTS